VAVKVQYPGIAEAVETDLRGAELLDRLVSAIFRGQEPGVILAELRERMTEECDYLAEARAQEEFRLRWAGRAGFQIPRVYQDISSRRILVSDLSPGESFDSFLAHASGQERDRAGELIFTFFIESFCRDRVFNADPHPGNYLFLDGDVVLLDFGCVRRLDHARIDWWKHLMRAYLERRFEMAQQLLIEAAVVPDPARYDFWGHHRMVFATYEFILCSEPFRFDTEFMRRLLNARGRDNRGLFRSSVAKDLVFANRMALGLFALLFSPGSPRGLSRNHAEPTVRARRTATAALHGDGAFALPHRAWAVQCLALPGCSSRTPERCYGAVWLRDSARAPHSKREVDRV
jgi:hypothetical protein